MNYNEQLIDFWKNNDFRDIKHPSSEFPEGWDARDELIRIIAHDTVNEVGCGYGRLVGKFNPTQYRGFDINPACVTRAKVEHPEYEFDLINPGDSLPPSDWVLFYTVALHVDDSDIFPFMSVVTANCTNILIAEILGRSKWRNRTNDFQFTFNRDEREYTEMLNRLGFQLKSHHEKPYQTLNGEPFSFLTYTRNV